MKRLIPKVTVLLLCMILSIQSFALSPGEDSDNEMDANWGSKFRDYLCDYDGNLVETNMGTRAFKLTYNRDEVPDDNDSKKSALIESIQLIATSKGPNGQSTKESGDKFIAVEITLAIPTYAKNADFSIFYKVECKKDIKNVNKDLVLDKGDTAEGSWYGRGKTEEKVITSSVSISEGNTKNLAYSSADYDTKTIIRFGSTASFAVNWEIGRASCRERV